MKPQGFGIQKLLSIRVFRLHSIGTWRSNVYDSWPIGIQRSLSYDCRPIRIQRSHSMIVDWSESNDQFGMILGWSEFNASIFDVRWPARIQRPQFLNRCPIAIQTSLLWDRRTIRVHFHGISNAVIFWHSKICFADRNLTIPFFMNVGLSEANDLLCTVVAWSESTILSLSLI